jgi:hypothetical protein
MTDKLENSVSYFPLNNPENVLILIRFFFYIFVQMFTQIFKIFFILKEEAQTKAKAPFIKKNGAYVRRRT